MPPPERWDIYSRIGNNIPGTRFICCKTPLKAALMSGLEDSMKFSPKDTVELIQEKGHTLGMVIDLTFTSKYYCVEDFTSNDVQHFKLHTYGQQLPQKDIVDRFFDAVETFKEENSENDKLIVVHCTHGVNRTGYLVCRYMIERLAFSPQEALKAFGDARGHPVERENYIEDLHNHSHNPNYENQGRHKLPHNIDSQKRGRGRGYHHHGDHRPHSSNYNASRNHGFHNADSQEMCGANYSGNPNNHTYARQNSDSSRHHPYRGNDQVRSDQRSDRESYNWRADRRDQYEDRSSYHRSNSNGDNYRRDRNGYCDYRTENRSGRDRNNYHEQGYRQRGYQGNNERYDQNQDGRFHSGHRGGRGAHRRNWNRGYHGNGNRGYHHYQQSDRRNNYQEGHYSDRKERHSRNYHSKEYGSSYNQQSSNQGRQLQSENENS